MATYNLRFIIVLALSYFSVFTSYALTSESFDFDKDTLNTSLGIFPASAKHDHKTVLTFTIVNPTKVTIKIFDVDGREVAYLFERNIPAGSFELFLETKHMKKGMYYCKFFTGEKIPMKKMIIVE